MSKLETISLKLDTQTKEALTTYCHRKGLKIQHFIESAIIEKLEEIVDLEAYHQRKDEEVISLDMLLKGENESP
ncbi:MAG: hypothetical protein CME67_05690 [Halobacteriovoraceae bacterium]|nr:hypothetical protein [Halobacteriovoraceae bacterium]|tara:strand:+ start:7264 stop:7485 length:222 start_codon:yes stop_codon:yes gene_type:complete